MTAPPLPKGLGAAGRALWLGHLAEFEAEPGELVVLEHAARTADELGRLSAAIAGGELVVAGSTGQPRAHPLLAEVRAHRDLLARLVARLAPPAAEASATMSELGRRAARARWDKQRRPEVVR